MEYAIPLLIGAAGGAAIMRMYIWYKLKELAGVKTTNQVRAKLAKRD